MPHVRSDYALALLEVANLTPALLVADACSGLHSMFSLTALGTLFMYITARKSRLHNALMLASILPIAFVANVIRVIILVLVTYHFGDEAGQGFLHGAAGMVLMLVLIGWLVLLADAVWVIYRLVIGALKLSESKPIAEGKFGLAA